MSASQTASMLNGGGDSSTEVTLDMMDYKFIDKSNDVKLLEKILRNLRSGNHGYYPHLIQHCEDKIMGLNPKSKALRKEKPVLRPRDLSETDQSNISSGMKDWSSKMKDADKEATQIQKNGQDLPPVRSTTHIKGSKKEAVKPKSKSKRIPGHDFKAWEKFDADQECEKVDQAPTPVPPTNTTKVNIPHTVEASNLTEEEKSVKSSQEKEKGNEAFKSGDFEEALAYYSRSISLVEATATINNRALAYIRLREWHKAEEDCDQVLAIEPENIKAKLRRATAAKELGKLDRAKADLEFVLAKEPKHVQAKKLLDDIASCSTPIENKKPQKGGRKIVIDEVESDDEAEETRNNINQGNHVPVESESPALSNHDNSGNASGMETRAEQPKKVDVPATDQAKTNELNKDNTSSGTSEKRSPQKVMADASPEPTVNVPEPKEAITKSVESTSKPSKTEAAPKAKEAAPKAEEAASTEEESKPSEPEVPEVVQKPLSARADKIKQEANNLFRTGQYGAASEKYSLAIRKVDNADEFSHALAQLYNNRAACKLKIGEDNSCIEDCTRVLSLKPFDVKALMRRGQAYEHKERYKQSYVDYKTAQTVDFNANQAQEGANRVAKHLRDQHGPKWLTMLPEIPQVSSRHKAPSQPARHVPTDSKPIATPPQPEIITKRVEVKSTPVETPKQNQPNPKPAQPKHSAKNGKKKAQPLTAKEKKEAEKKKKLRLALYDKQKQKGNDFVKEGKYEEAVEVYTQCIKIDPTQVACYTNRALCYLKLNNELAAENDCTDALKLDPNNAKALFRRAQSRIIMKLLETALVDLTCLLKVDPRNKQAREEYKRVKQQVDKLQRFEDKLVDKSVPRPKKRIDIDESSDEEEEVPQRPPPRKSPPRPASASFPHVVLTDEDRLPIDSPYEFGYYWNAVHPKNNFAAYQNILDRVPNTDDIVRLVSNKIDDHMIRVFVQIALRHIKDGSCAADMLRAHGLIVQLTKAKRFEMAAMFLSSDDPTDPKKLFKILKTGPKRHPEVAKWTDEEIDELSTHYIV